VIGVQKKDDSSHKDTTKYTLITSKMQEQNPKDITVDIPQIHSERGETHKSGP